MVPPNAEGTFSPNINGTLDAQNIPLMWNGTALTVLDVGDPSAMACELVRIRGDAELVEYGACRNALDRVAVHAGE